MHLALTMDSAAANTIPLLLEVDALNILTRPPSLH